MAVRINADTVTGGAVVTADATGIMELQSGGSTKLTLNSSGVTLASALPIASGGTNSTATATAGGIGYGTGTAHAYTSAGTTGQVLTSAGASAPTWSTPASGMNLVSTTTISAGSSSVNVESFSSTYDTYMVVLENMTFTSVSASGTLAMRFKLNGTYKSGNYDYRTGYFTQTSAGPTGTVDTTGETFFSAAFFNQISNGSGIYGAYPTPSSLGINFVMYLNNVNSTTFTKSFSCIANSVYLNSTIPCSIVNHTSGLYAGKTSGNPTSVLTGIQLFESSSTFTMSGGTIRVYGLAK